MRIQETPTPSDIQDAFIEGHSIPIISIVEPDGGCYYAVLDCDGGAYE